MRNEPAFPVSTDTKFDESQNCAVLGHQTGPHTWQFSGLTKRELFAAMALQGLTSSANWNGKVDVARWSVDLADKLIRELGRKSNV